MPKRVSEKLRRLRKAQLLGEGENSARSELEQELDPNNRGSRSHAAIIRQVQQEYELAWRFMRPKIQEWLVRLKLYNNQRRDKDRVGDPMLFTTHQTVLAALYDDRLASSFGGREEGDEETAENLNGLSEFDYEEMEKYILDYFWDWDAGFFGYGLCYFNEFDRATKTPLPVIWDPTTFLRDPHCSSVNGDRLAQGSLQYGGREVLLTKGQMEDIGDYINLGKLRKRGETNAFSLTQETHQARSNAQGTQTLSSWEKMVGPTQFAILQWFTYIDGEKHLVELGNERSLVVRVKRLEDRKGDPVKRWPLIDRRLYPMSHDFDGVSISDIVEDKQRFRAAHLNVLGESSKADLYPMYLFNENKVKKQIDKSFGFNKWIPVDGDINAAVAPLQKAQPSSLAQYILDFLDLSVQKALATPELRQGVPSKQDRTLGEQQLAAAGADTRYSLSARVFGWSEKAFWKRWYEVYEENFEDGIDEKVMRLMGTFGPTWRKLKRSDIIVGSSLGPDIKIESRVISEAKKARLYQQLSNYFTLAFQAPNADILYGARKLGRQVLPRDEVERLLPLTVDERIAKEENERLNDGDFVAVSLEDDHNVHLRMHAAVEENDASEKHIKAHERALMVKRVRPELFPMLEQPPPEAKGQPAGSPLQQIPEGVSAPAAPAT